MPDLNIETAWTCATNLDWETTVPSSSGNGTYTVRYERLYDPRATTQYGWTCTCKGYQTRRTCKHVKQLEENDPRCRWNWDLEPFVKAGENSDGEPCCPECGGPVQAIRVGV